MKMCEHEMIKKINKNREIIQSNVETFVRRLASPKRCKN